MGSIKTNTTSKARWFSENPDKAWGEKFFLIYSLIWMLQMAFVMASGLVDTLGDVGFIIQSSLVALPLLLIPCILHATGLCGANRSGLRWYESYWFKANVYIFVFSFFGNYFGTEYFFDVLGMVYNYQNVHWNFDAALLGSGEQKVPVMMFLLTHAYFMTYHSSAVVVLRRINTSGVRGAVLLFPLFVFVIGYCWAWMETKAMANPMIAEYFYYKEMARMLAYGSLMYACYFIASFPIFYFMDEGKTADKRNVNWSVWVTIAASLSASMLTFYLLDFWTKYVGAII